MAGNRLCQELLNCIFEHVIRPVAGGADNATSQYQILHQQQQQQDVQQQRSEAPSKRVRSASAQNTTSASHGSSRRTCSAQGTLCSAARVSKSWNSAATKLLYYDPGSAISRYEGLYLPHLLASLRKDTYLRDCVRAFTITASLEAGLWVSDYAREGDLFCELVELCPRIKALTVPSFEVSCRNRILNALTNCRSMESFDIRVYLESSRRDPRFAKLIPYDSWKLELVAELVASWPKLQQVTVRHIPDNSYHLIPDIVMKPPKNTPYTLMPHAARLTTLSLRETFIDDQGLFHLMQNSALTRLCLMSCQGITSSGITRQGMLDAIKQAAPTLEHLTVMTPWLPSSARPGEPDFVIDRALRYTHKLKTLCVAGYDVTNAFLRILPHPELLEELDIMDFELVTPQVIFEVANSTFPTLNAPMAATPAKLRRFSRLSKLAVWQRNAGVGRARVSNGWFRSAFTRADMPATVALQKAGIKLATGWESRLISGSPIEHHEPHLTAAAFEELDRLSPV